MTSDDADEATGAPDAPFSASDPAQERRVGRLGIIMPIGTLGGGAEMALLDLTGTMAVDRIRFGFLAPGSLADAVADAGGVTRVVAGGRIRQVASALSAGRSLGRWFRSEGVTSVLVWMNAAILVGWRAAQVARADLYWYQHGLCGPPAPLDRLATALPASGVLACSERAAELQRKVWPYRPVHVVHPPIDLSRVRASVFGGRQAAREALGLPQECAIALTVGRLERGKRLDLLIGALPSLPSEVLAVLVGGSHVREPGTAAELWRLAEQLGVSDRVLMPGWRSDIAHWIEAADVLVSPSEREAFGITMVESLALGTPVIGALGGGAEEIVRNGNDGLLIDSSDQVSLVCALTTVLEGGLHVDGADLRHRADAFGADRAAARMLRATNVCRTWTPGLPCSSS